MSSIDTTNIEICVPCQSNYIKLPTEARLVCPSCGVQQDYIDTSANTVAYGEEVEYSSFQYRRITHFMELLTNIQFQESHRVPVAILERVMQGLLNCGLQRSSDITFDSVHETTRALGIRRYYKYEMQIYCRITGRTAPVLAPKTIEILKLMFMAIQEPWETYCPDERKNFLSYPYCLYKFAQLLDVQELLPYLCLLKCHKKLTSQEQTFRQICTHLDWPFIPI